MLRRGAIKIPPWVGHTCAALLTGGMMAVAFPPLEGSDAAWVALIPLLISATRASPRALFMYGFIAGALFWLLTIFWLTKVTWAGWILLSLYCALFMAVFWATAALLIRRFGTDRFLGNLGLLIFLTLAWVGLEFLRSVLFTGFAWQPLGVSQYQKTALIQVSAWTGVYGVSALIVWMNVALTLTLLRYIRLGLRGRRAWHPELMMGFLALVLAIQFGGRWIRNAPSSSRLLRVALIQPNIPQYEKWTRAFVEHIYSRLDSLTRMAIQAGGPDLVVWPETAVPDYVREGKESHRLVHELTRLGAPILVGSMDIEWPEEGPPLYFNSSVLFDTAGTIREVYDKQHLVMFGEYIPLRPLGPIMKAMTPIEESFDAGTESTVFELDGPEVRFSALICFEDTVAKLARRAVRAGARLLINQTNDAWFDVSSASQQHMTHSVFRAVENRVPVVRSANTGVSCHIDRFGRIRDTLADEQGQTLITGFKMIRVETSDPDMALTFYTRHGDVFGWTALLALGMIWVGERIRSKLQ